MKKMFIIVLSSCFISASTFCAMPAEKPEHAKSISCKCDPCTCNPCLCTNAEACKVKAQKAESVAIVQAAQEKKCCPSVPVIK